MSRKEILDAIQKELYPTEFFIVPHLRRERGSLAQLINWMAYQNWQDRHDALLEMKGIN